MHLAAPITTS